MRIRTLDQDVSSNQLEVVWGGDGDVYFNIYQNRIDSDGKKKYCGMPVSVRVGMAGSGMRLPGKLGKIIADLANEFEKYKDCTFESDCPETDEPKFENVTKLADDYNARDGKWSFQVFKMKYNNCPYTLTKERTGAWFKYSCGAWVLETVEDLSINETLKSLIDSVINKESDGRGWRIPKSNS